MNSNFLCSNVSLPLNIWWLNLFLFCVCCIVARCTTFSCSLRFVCIDAFVSRYGFEVTFYNRKLTNLTFQSHQFFSLLSSQEEALSHFFPEASISFESSFYFTNITHKIQKNITSVTENTNKIIFIVLLDIFICANIYIQEYNSFIS